MDLPTGQCPCGSVWTFEKTPWHRLKFLSLLSRLVLLKSQQRDFWLSAALPDIKESNEQLISYTNMLLVITVVSLLLNKLRVDFRQLHTTKTQCFSDEDTPLGLIAVCPMHFVPVPRETTSFKTEKGNKQK